MEVDLFQDSNAMISRTAWQVIDAARRQFLTGVLTLETMPPTHVYLRDGQVYFAERSTDGSLPVRLLVEGVITREQMHRGTVIVSGVEHLGRMFDRDETIDRDSVELCLELMTDDVLSSVADETVTEYTMAMYKRHPAGIDRWLRSTIEVVTHLVEHPHQLPPDAPAPTAAPAAAAVPVPVASEPEPEAPAAAIAPVPEPEQAVDVVDETAPAAQAEPEPEPQAETDIELDVVAEIEPEIEPEPEVEAEPEALAEVEVQVEAEPEIEPEPEIETEPAAAVEPEIEPEPEVEPATEAPMRKVEPVTLHLAPRPEPEAVEPVDEVQLAHSAMEAIMSTNIADEVADAVRRALAAIDSAAVPPASFTPDDFMSVAHLVNDPHEFA